MTFFTTAVAAAGALAAAGAAGSSSSGSEAAASGAKQHDRLKPTELQSPARRPALLRGRAGLVSG